MKPQADELPAVVLGTPQALRQSLQRRGQLKGRQPDEASVALVQALIGPRPAAGYRRDLLIETLHLLSDSQRCLREPHLVALARLMNVPMAEVYEVATFYHHFEVKAEGVPVAAVRVRVCESLSCELAGARDLLAHLPARLGDADIEVVAVPCIGRCEQAPAAEVNQQAVGHATLDKLALVATTLDKLALVATTLDKLALVATTSKTASKPAENPFFESNQPIAKVNIASIATDYIAYDAYRAAGGYALAAAVACGEQGQEAVLKVMEGAGLRGLGGAGFPAGRKWRIVRDQPAPKLMVVNIDEGEPGTFKDRTYLERDPHRFLEGMLVAAQVVGISAIYIYLRDEYHDCRHLLAREIAALQANPPCPLPLIELRRGAGAYICGEESAMLESIEGKRGEPRMRPPYIAQVGLFGRPTLAHNFETLYWVREIVEKGAQWFASQGRNGRTGLRSFSVSGRVKDPGVKLAPAGITLRELVDEFCGGMADGHQLYAYLPGGASGGIFPAHLADTPLDFDTLQPHGGFIGSAAVIVLGQHDKARDAALNVMRFFEHESCGQCTPCRVGTAKAAALMQAPVWDNATLEDLSQVMTDASICGLGQAAPNPVRCVQLYFPHEIGAAI
ncbi:MAG: NAD(P)H-dependent oxidoreductase subunit E [Burkholderiaceae bacterium]